MPYQIDKLDVPLTGAKSDVTVETKEVKLREFGVMKESVYPDAITMAQSQMSVDAAGEVSNELRNAQARCVRAFCDGKVAKAQWALRKGYSDESGQRKYLPESELESLVYEMKLRSYRLQSTISEYAGSLNVEDLRARLDNLWAAIKIGEPTIEIVVAEPIIETKVVVPREMK